MYLRPVPVRAGIVGRLADCAVELIDVNGIFALFAFVVRFP